VSLHGSELHQHPLEGEKQLKVTCGIDWSEKHHDVALVDADGTLVARKRVPDDASGYKTLLELFAEHGDTPEDQIPVAIETGRGLLVACLRHRPRGLCHQPAVCRPLSRAPHRRPVQERPR
jgi:hypothetical protein